MRGTWKRGIIRRLSESRRESSPSRSGVETAASDPEIVSLGKPKNRGAGTYRPDPSSSLVRQRLLTVDRTARVVLRIELVLEGVHGVLVAARQRRVRLRDDRGYGLGVVDEAMTGVQERGHGMVKQSRRNLGGAAATTHVEDGEQCDVVEAVDVGNVKDVFDRIIRVIRGVGPGLLMVLPEARRAAVIPENGNALADLDVVDRLGSLLVWRRSKLEANRAGDQRLRRRVDRDDRVHTVRLTGRGDVPAVHEEPRIGLARGLVIGQLIGLDVERVCGEAADRHLAAPRVVRSRATFMPTDLLDDGQIARAGRAEGASAGRDRKSTRLNSSHSQISY